MNNNLPAMIHHPKGVKFEEEENMEENNQTNKGEALGLETHKAQGKGVGAEHLRTELKSVENRNPTVPTQVGTDNRALLTRNPLYM